MSDLGHSLHALDLLLEQVTRERDRLLDELARAEGQLQRCQQQGAQLSGYRGEYTQRWSQRFGQGGAIEIMHCYHAFMQRLNEALVHQQRQTEAAERATAAARAALLQCELRAASIGKLIERRRAELARSLQRREQRQTDEIAQRLRQPGPLQRKRALS